MRNLGGGLGSVFQNFCGSYKRFRGLFCAGMRIWVLRGF